jgi:hypothetical protein
MLFWPFIYGIQGKKIGSSKNKYGILKRGCKFDCLIFLDLFILKKNIPLNLYSHNNNNHKNKDMNENLEL